MRIIYLLICVLSITAKFSDSFAESSLAPARLKKAQIGESYRQRVRFLSTDQNKKVTRCPREGYLPDGLSFSEGLISGLPTRVEKCSFCLRAGSRKLNTYTRNAYNLTVEGEDPFTISTQVTRQATNSQDGEMQLTVSHVGQGIPIDRILVGLRPGGCAETDGGSSLLLYQPGTPMLSGDSYTTTFEFPDLSSGACLTVSVEGYDGNGNRLDCRSIATKKIRQADID